MSTALHSMGVSTRSQGSKAKAVVTGGVGFLGQHLVQQLLDSGKYEVTVFDIRDTGVSKAPVVVGDLRKPEQVSAALRGADVVFHCATATPTGENVLNKALMDGVNVDGTTHVIAACVEHGIPRLVFTSSSSVVTDGSPLYNVDESRPYSRKPMDYYTKTKIKAEQLVLAANGKGALRTVALRPSAIFGGGDLVMVPTLIKQARLGKSKYIIGNGKNKIDWTYVGNVAQAHLDAADALADPQRAAIVAGKPFFITNQEPRLFWGFLGDICEGLGYVRPHIRLPFPLMLFLAVVFEYVVCPLVKPFKKLTTEFTVGRMLIISRERTFSSEAARKELGYIPKVKMDEALRRTLTAFEHLRNPKQPALANGATSSATTKKST